MPCTEQALNQLFPAPLQKVLFAEYVVRPWDLCRDLDMGIHTLKLYSPKAQPLVISTAKSEELREFRRGKKDRMCGAGCAERKNQRDKERGKGEMETKDNKQDKSCLEKHVLE